MDVWLIDAAGADFSPVLVSWFSGPSSSSSVLSSSESLLSLSLSVSEVVLDVASKCDAKNVNKKIEIELKRKKKYKVYLKIEQFKRKIMKKNSIENNRVKI